MITFKYCDHRGVDILKMQRLKVTRPKEFNDPFEFTPTIVGEFSEAQAEELFADEKFVQWQFEIIEARGGTFPGGYDAFCKAFKEPFLRRQLAKKFPSVHRENMRRLARENLNQVSREFGVLCLSTVSDSITMWSHYADNHRGILVGFDSNHTHFAGRQWFAVKYARDRVAVDIAWTLDRAGESTGMARHVFETKSEVWRYEKELRSIFKLSDLESRVSNEREDYFWRIPKDAILQVKLGHRCPKATEESVKAAISENDLSQVSIEKADLDETQFALIFRPS